MLKKMLFFAIATICISAPAFSAPTINFTALGSLTTYNSAQHDTSSLGGIAINGFVYESALATYRQDKGFLWLRNNSVDHGLGYCSTGENCGAVNTTGNGDTNELSNENKNELIRLTRPDNVTWSDISVSSLDDGGTNGDETGTVYWSNSATPNLQNGSTAFINFSHDGLGWNGSTVEGSIFGYLVAHGFDVQAKNIFFRSGELNGFGLSTNGTNNDYLVWGVNVTAPIPEPEIYTMLAAGLGLIGFMARRRKSNGE